MKDIIARLFTILFYIVGLVAIQVRKLRFVARGPVDNAGVHLEKINTQDLITDALEVFKPTRVYFIFNIVVFLMFLLLPQGQDIILVVIEDLSRFNFIPLLSLLIGVAGWSVLAEFGARYKIYISDNSGKSLSGARVVYRKQFQQFLSMVYLLLPYVVVLLSVIFLTFSNISLNKWDWGIMWPFVALIILLFLSAAGLAIFYLDEKFIRRFTGSNSWLSKFLKLPPEEKRWLDKLYGIYQDYVFVAKKATVFTDDTHVIPVKTAYTHFANIIKNIPAKSFPDDYILPEEQAPTLFRPPTHLSDEYKPDFTVSPYTYDTINPAGSYRWIYKNDPNFYKVLHRQVRAISIVSLCVLVLISLGFFIPYTVMGSPGIVCFSLGCWQGVYTGLLYIDNRYRRNFYISIRWVLFIWFFVVSFIDRDHPVRYNELGKGSDNRLELNAHFENWLTTKLGATSAFDVLASNGSDSSNKQLLHRADSIYAQQDSVRVIFIAAEGGALRTGAFTAMLLAKLQDSIPAFREHIYAFSTVSGGSVGVSFFNAMNYLEHDTVPGGDKAYYSKATRKFFTNDQLSPVLAKTFYGEVLNYFWPAPIQRFDRAIVLEKEWEHDFNTTFPKADNRNTYSQDFLTLYCHDSLAPAWFINTTEVESGLQCFISGVRPDSFLFARQRDLLYEKIRGGINYSTAVNFSSRFPLFSPSAALPQDADRIFHYVDGGYVENTGAKTMLEILQAIRSKIHKYKVKPYVVQLKFGEDGDFNSTSFVNEISSVINGIYNTRAGSSKTYSELLQTYTEKTLGGEFIKVPLPASSKEVPMSWIFSDRSMGNLVNAIDTILANPSHQLVKLKWLNDIRSK